MASQGRLFAFWVGEQALALRCRHHLAGMGEGFGGEIDATEHAGDFLNAVAVLQVGYGGAGWHAAASFVHEQVVMALGGHLRQVGNGQDLAAFTQSAQELANTPWRWGPPMPTSTSSNTRPAPARVCAVMT